MIRKKIPSENIPDRKRFFSTVPETLGMLPVMIKRVIKNKLLFQKYLWDNSFFGAPGGRTF